MKYEEYMYSKPDGYKSKFTDQVIANDTEVKGKESRA